MKDAFKQSENAFMRQVLALARLQGWLRAHFRPAMLKSGRWVTPVQGDGKGFPDLVLVRERVLFVETKVHGNKLTPEQHRWRVALLSAGADYRLWYPSDWDEIQSTLARA